jgi:diguanylate cyclase (GGDEF)-like protein
VINIGLDFAAEQDVDRLLGMVCVASRDLFAATTVTLGIVDRTGLVVERLVTCDASAVGGIKAGDAVTGVHRTVVAERRTVRGEHSDVDPTGRAGPVLVAKPQAFLIAPVASGAHVHGWVALVAHDGKSFTDDDESLLVALGGLVGRTYEIGHLSQHDFLTGLPNRLLLADRVAQTIAAARRTGQSVAVLFVDLDRFKHVNDSLGHSVGDLLLQSVARRLVSCLRSCDTVSRHGGDEFVVLLSGIESADDAGTAAEKLVAALAPPHPIERQQLYLSATIGISMYPDDSTDGETLIRCADLAMYQAKNERQPYRFFEPGMNARALERQRIEADLHLALERGEFVLHYQPRIDLRTHGLVGAEALLRWMHPERGLLFPGEFVPVAEDCGLMVPIGRWVLAAACAQGHAWVDDARPPMTMAVNISAGELRDPGFLEHVRSVLGKSRMDPRLLELELTESALMQHVVEAEAAHPGVGLVFEHRGNLVGDWDADRLLQVVSNLVGNAIQHGAGTAVALSATASGDVVTLRVRNGGPAVGVHELGGMQPAERIKPVEPDSVVHQSGGMARRRPSLCQRANGLICRPNHRIRWSPEPSRHRS